MPDELVSSEKTPVAALHEFCMQNEELLTYDYVPHETDPKMFSCIAQAFDLHARGSGRSKKVAKHDACAKLIGKYFWIEFLDKIQIVNAFVLSICSQS